MGYLGHADIKTATSRKHEVGHFRQLVNKNSQTPIKYFSKQKKLTTLLMKVTRESD